MLEHVFEIIRRTYDRFGWVLVKVEDGRRRVLARSDSDWSSAEKAGEAALAFKELVADAKIVDGSGSTEPEPFPLPATSFYYVPGVVPLVVRESPGEYEPAVAGRRRPTQRGRAEEPRAVEPALPAPVVQEQVVEAPPQPAVEEKKVEAASEPAAVPVRRRASRGSRRQQGK
jgi:hypothetical protein